MQNAAASQKLPRRRGNGRDRGFVLITTVVLTGLVLSVAIMLIDNIISSRQAAKYAADSTIAVEYAEAGIAKAVFCLRATDGTNCGGTYGTGYTGEKDVSFAGGKFTVAVSGDTEHKTITATGYAPDDNLEIVRTEVTIDPITVPQSGFGYAVQVGDQGMQLGNNAEVNNGTIYSGSDIVCSNNGELNYDVYVSKPGGKIDGCKGLHDAHADYVLNSKVQGDAYYDLDPQGISGTTVKGFTHPGSPTPSALSLPTLDLDKWKQAATAGGTHTGDYTLTNNQTAQIGPIEIDGDLVLKNNVTVTLNGPVWVKGNVDIGNNSSISLASNFGAASGILIADNPSDTATYGKVVIGNNAVVQGSGTDGSYLIIASTNTSLDSGAPAIDVQNNSAAGIFYDPYGLINISNNGSAVEAIGRQVLLNNNAQVNYDYSGATPAGMSIATYPGGMWRFLPGMWRRVK